jgi:hypothetical protein
VTTSEQQAVPVEQETMAQPGFVVWHSSEEDGGPDVGITVGLGDGKMLWIGERSGREGNGMGLLVYGDQAIDGNASLGEYDEIRDLIEKHVAPAFSRLAATSLHDMQITPSVRELGSPCENCGKPVEAGQLILYYDDVGEMHADCENPFSLEYDPPKDASPEPMILLGSPMVHVPLALIAPDRLAGAGKPIDATQTREAHAPWVPRIGDPVRVSPSDEYQADWARMNLWVAGLSVDDHGRGIDVTVSEQWPIPSRHSREYMGQTDGFLIARTDGRPDSLEPRTVVPAGDAA